MTTLARITASRSNARQSTGPRTLEGRRASSRNATRHGVLSVVPVVSGVETAEAWREHSAAVLASLEPVGYLEVELAERVALVLWRLRRVVRYETALLSDASGARPGRDAAAAALVVAPATLADADALVARVEDALALVDELADGSRHGPGDAAVGALVVGLAKQIYQLPRWDGARENRHRVAAILP